MKSFLSSLFGTVLGALVGFSAITYSAVTLQSSITGTGMNQGDLVSYLENIRDVVNEIQTDHATTKTAVDELNTLTDELRADHATYKTLTDELHVDVDLNGAALAGILAKLDADGGITDTNYVAIHGRSGSGAAIQAAAVTASDPATITAAEATAGPATLTNATALTLLGG